MSKLNSARRSPKQSKRTRWSAEDARRLLAKWPAGEMSLSAFARRLGVRPRRLYRWREKLQKVTPPQISFKEISLPRSAVDPPGPLEIVLRSGAVVRVGKSFDESALRRLLEVLASAPA